MSGFPRSVWLQVLAKEFMAENQAISLTDDKLCPSQTRTDGRNTGMG